MKAIKFVSVALTAAIGMSLIAGCNNTPGGASNLSLETSSSTQMSIQTTVAEGVEGYEFEFKGQKIRVNTDMNSVLPNLGTDYAYFEAASCAGIGMSKTYTFGNGSVIISTNPNGAVDVIASIALTDDTIQTPEGIYIGSSKDDVIKAYGNATEETESTLTYQKNDTMIVFVLSDNGTVNNIIYNGVI